MSGLLDGRCRLRVIVPQPAQQESGGFGTFVPLFHSGGVAELGQPLEQADEPLADVPVALAEGVSQILASGFGAVVGGSRLADGKQQVTQWCRGERVGGVRRAPAAPRGYPHRFDRTHTLAQLSTRQ